MLGVLVVVLGPDQISRLGFGLRQREIALIIALGVLRALLLGAAAIVVLRPSPLAGRK
jgi:hypothetical protein